MRTTCSRTLLALLLAATAIALPARAQCLFTSVTATATGEPCNAASTGFCAVAAFPSFLLPELDPTNCTLDVTITAFESCGAVVPLRVLAIGFQPAAVPLPEFGIGCELQVVPIALLTTPSPTVSVALPPGVPTMSFLAQGLAWSHFAPAANPDVFAFTSGYTIDLQ